MPEGAEGGYCVTEVGGTTFDTVAAGGLSIVTTERK